MTRNDHERSQGRRLSTANGSEGGAGAAVFVGTFVT